MDLKEQGAAFFVCSWMLHCLAGFLRYQVERYFQPPVLDKSGKIRLVFEVPEKCIPVRGLGVENDHQKEVSIESFPGVSKIKYQAQLTLHSYSAIFNIRGGDEPRAGYGRTTSAGGSDAGSQLRNRPLGSVRFNFG